MILSSKFYEKVYCFYIANLAICGYEYRGEIPFEGVPDEFVCPVCKQPKSVFVKK